MKRLTHIGEPFTITKKGLFKTQRINNSAFSAIFCWCFVHLSRVRLYSKLVNTHRRSNENNNHS